MYQPTVWIQNGGSTTNHGDVTYNHWMTTNAAYGIYYASVAYENQYRSGLVLSNDMALPWGGKFDLNDDWGSPHVTHDWGTAADIDGVPMPACVNGVPTPGSNAAQFLQYCMQKDAIEISCHTNLSLHCRWAN